MLSFARSFVSFGEHVEASLRSKSTCIGELNPFLEFGLYCEQLGRYFELFPRERIRIYFYSDYIERPRAMLRDAFEFLGVNPAFAPDLSSGHMQAAIPRSYKFNRALKRSGLWQLARRFSPPGVRRAVFRPRHAICLEAGDRTRLVEFYREDVMNLSSLLKCDLSGWLKI